MLPAAVSSAYTIQVILKTSTSASCRASAIRKTSSSKSTSPNRRPGRSPSVLATPIRTASSVSSAWLKRTCAVRAIRPISAGNSAGIRIPIRTTSSRILIPTSTMPATPSASVFSTANRNTTIMMKKVIPSLNTTAVLTVSTSRTAASAANTSAITSRWKRSGQNMLVGIADTTTAIGRIMQIQNFLQYTEIT